MADATTIDAKGQNCQDKASAGTSRFFTPSSVDDHDMFLSRANLTHIPRRPFSNEQNLFLQQCEMDSTTKQQRNFLSEALGNMKKSNKNKLFGKVKVSPDVSPLSALRSVKKKLTEPLRQGKASADNASDLSGHVQIIG